ncbi:Isochorismatase hydrolase [Bimuria novae-zelandiae CBS 107.79]|uniref:nicotinamidase n=1 Tax=Bimuria novae-zelandiae CBS 107.79 TaxID=1447943 RepID=A0A6A5VLI9_9PLEO|nr:Isochorismatase hydrolase [Bimuria novae-zelandiae CBS 107.79]
MKADFLRIAASAVLTLGPLVHAVPYSPHLHKSVALVLIDIQNDFIDGSLGSPRASAILPKVYKLLEDHEWPFIAASQDWHPKDHVSFASAHADSQLGGSVEISFVDSPLKTENQSLYADHCVPGTWGAQLESGIQSRLWDLEGYRAPVHYIKKAQDHSVDSYSAFADNQYHRFTTLHSELSLHSINTIVVTGLITSACVRGTSIDGIKLGYEVILIEDATESFSAEDKENAIKELQGWGVQVKNLTDWEAEHPTSATGHY